MVQDKNENECDEEKVSVFRRQNSTSQAKFKQRKKRSQCLLCLENRGHKLYRFFSLSNWSSVIVWRRPFGAGWLVNGGERSGIRLL